MPPVDTAPGARRRQLDSIVALSESMLGKAQSSDWPAVQELAVDRDRMLKDFFALPSGVDEAEFVADGIQRMLEINTRLLELGTTTQRDCVEGLGAINAGRRAIDSYNAHR